MSSSKVKCTCGWSWNKSDSSAKDMYICHECGRDNSNNMKNGGWLDNYNDSQVSAPEGFEGDGYSNVGRDYSPAWRGQFEEGGEIPNAQKGKKVKYVESANDPRYKAYQDSLSLYEGTKDISKMIRNNPVKAKWKDSEDDVPSKYIKKIINTKNYSQLTKKEKEKVDEWNKTSLNPNIKPYKYETYGVNQPKGKVTHLFGPDEVMKERITIPYGQPNPFYKKPEQLILVKPTTTKETTKPSNTEWTPLTKEIAKGRYEGDLKNMVYRKKADGSYDITYQAPSEVSRQPAKALQINPQSKGLVHGDTELNADVSGLHPEARRAKYFNIQDIVHGKMGDDITDYRWNPSMEPLRELAPEPYNTRKITPQYQMGGSVYPVNYVPQAQEGKQLTFLQPNSDKLPQGYRIPYSDPSSERAMSIGGENGEPAYLIPSFKYGQPLYNAIEEFRNTGEHLGGPFKTHQEADQWEQDVRHPYVEKGQAIPMPIKTWGEMAMGGSIPGAVGFSYARTQGAAPSNGKYAKKTMASAQNGVDMYENPMLARRVDNPNVNRSYYDPRLNTMNIGTDYDAWKDEYTGEQLTGDDLKYHQDKLLAHENYHAIQHSQDRDNYDIAHDTDNAQWAQMQKRPEVMSTDAVWNNFYNRSDSENQQDYQEMINSYPESRILNQNLLFDKVLDRQRYDNPANLEGEAKFYEDTGVDIGKQQSEISLNPIRFQNGGEMRYYQHGLDWKPKGMKDGGWLDGYDKAQNGKQKNALSILDDVYKRKQQGQYKNVKVKDERKQVMNSPESTSIKRKDFDAEQSKSSKAYYNAVIAQKKEDARRAKLTKDQREREDYDIRNEQTGTITQSVPETTWERTKAIVSNPMTAAGYVARGENLPGRFQHGPRNEYDYAIDWVNPLQSGIAASQIPGQLGRGEFLDAGLSLLDAADLGIFAKGAGKALGTKSGLLSNAYKVNPYAEKLKNANKSYRVAGMDALEDFQNTGVLRSQRILPENATFLDRVAARPTSFPSFQKGYADLDYLPKEGGAIFETGLPTYKRGELNPVTGVPIKGRHYAHRVINPETGAALSEIPAADIRAFGAKPHWRKGYQEIPKQEDGGIIKDDRGQWDHPGEITEIGSNNITMEGVPYDVLGISDTGDTKLMKPGKNYKFKGKKVTEFPMAKNGVNQQDQKTLQQLDQLTNFTNYNKPTIGGWLNKYN